MNKLLILLLVAVMFFVSVSYGVTAPTTHYSDSLSNYKELAISGDYNLSYVFLYYTSDIKLVYFNMSPVLRFEGHNYTDAKDVVFFNYSLNEGYWYNTSDGVVAEAGALQEYNITLTIPADLERNFTFYVLLDNTTHNITTNLYLFVDTVAPRYDMYKNTTYDHYNYTVNITRTFSVNDTLFDHANYSVFWNISDSIKRMIYSKMYVKSNPFVFNYSSFAYLIRTDDFVFMPSVLDNGSNLFVPVELYDSANSLVGMFYLVYNYSYVYFSEGKISKILPASLLYIADLGLNPTDYVIGSNYYAVLGYLDENNNFVSSNYQLHENASMYIRAANTANYTLVYNVIDKVKNLNTTMEDFKINNSYAKNVPFISHVYPENNSRVLVLKDVIFEANIKDLATLNTTCDLVLAKDTTFTGATMERLYEGSFNTTYIFSEEGNYTYYWDCHNDLGLVNRSLTYHIEVLNLSDLTMAIKYFTKPYYKGTDFEGNITLCNSGSRDEVLFNVTIDVCTDSSCSNVLDHKNYYFESFPIEKCENLTFNISNMDGNYFVKASILNATNDYDTSDNVLIREFSTYPKVSIISMKNATGSNDLSNVLPGTNLTIVVNITDFEGNVMANLDENNLSIYDKWVPKATAYRCKEAYVYYDSSNALYVVNYTVPDLVDSKYYEYGDHDVILEVHDLTKYSAINATLSSYVLKAPYLDVVLELSDEAVEVDDTIIVRVRAKNVGNVATDFISAEINIVDSTIAVFTTNNDDTVVCEYSTDLAPSTAYTTLCEYSIKGVKEGSTQVRIDILSSKSFYNATGYKTMKLLSESRLTLEVVQPTSSTTETSSSTQTTTTTTSDETTTNSSSDQETSDEKVEPPVLEIEAPNTLSLTYPNATDITIGIINKGKQAVTLTRDNIDFAYDVSAMNVSYSLSKVTILPGKKHLIKLKIIPLDAGKYVLSVRVNVNGSAFNKDISITILPDDTKKREIMEMYDQLKEEIEQLKKSSDETTTSILNTIELKLQNVSYYLNQENYVEAYSLLKEAEEDLESLKSQLNVSKEESSSTWIWWVLGILVVVGAVGGAIFYYLWMPEQSGFDPSKGYYYVPPINEEDRKNYLEKFTEMIKRKLGLKQTLEEKYPDVNNKKEEW